MTPPKVDCTATQCIVCNSFFAVVLDCVFCSLSVLSIIVLGVYDSKEGFGKMGAAVTE